MNGSNDLYFIAQGISYLLIGGGICFYAALIVCVGVSLAYEWIKKKWAGSSDTFRESSTA